MMQVQITIHVPGENKNKVTVDLFEREDANDLEREMARNIQDMLQSVMEAVRDQSAPGEVEIEVIER
jgi:phosphate uptake regulator